MCLWVMFVCRLAFGIFCVCEWEGGGGLFVCWGFFLFCCCLVLRVTDVFFMQFVIMVTSWQGLLGGWVSVLFLLNKQQLVIIIMVIVFVEHLSI